MSPLDAGARKIVADLTSELRRRTERQDEGPMADFNRVLPAMLRLSTLSLRWLLEQGVAHERQRRARKGDRNPVVAHEGVLEALTIAFDRVSHGGKSVDVPRPKGTWIQAAIDVACEIARSRLPPDERRDNAANEAAMARELASARGDVAKRVAREKTAKERAVFLSRFFPVPKPHEWHPGFWTLGEYAQIEQELRNRLAAIENPVEPQWWPDGWKEAMER